MSCSWPNTPLSRLRCAVPRLCQPIAEQEISTTLDHSALLTARAQSEVIHSAGDLPNEIRNAWLRCREAIGSGDKDLVRNLHLNAKGWDRSVNYAELRTMLKRHRSYFPSGAKIEPARIDPELICVRTRSLEERLFKITRGYWSMPYSKGYGRRLRFVVMDRHHQALIGIIGLQSPSADLGCRDRYLGVPKENKLAVVNNTLDAYTIGATPTYAPLLGGKLIAGLLHSKLIRQEYWRAYGNKRTTQLNTRIPQPLLAITTASAFGRSSIYNRLRQGDRLLAKPLGYTKGFGTLHLEELYPKMTAWLKASGRHVPAGFGNGPKVRWQNIMRTLIDLGIPREYLSHGLLREVFIFELVGNLQAVCQDGATPDVTDFCDRAWVDFWKERWCLPRATRDASWYESDAYGIMTRALNPTILP